MYQDRKIKKEIEKRMVPRISFDDFCTSNNVTVESDAVQGEALVKTGSWAVGVGAALVFALVIAVGCFMIFMNGNKASPLPELKLYGTEQIVQEKISDDDFFAASGSTYIDISKSEQYGFILYSKPIGEDLLLGYDVKDILYGVNVNDKLYAYEMTLTIRVYEGYLFFGYADFDNLTNTYNEECKFKVDKNSDTAFVTVKHNGYEYFLTVKEYMGITPITEENVILLLDELL